MNTQEAIERLTKLAEGCSMIDQWHLEALSHAIEQMKRDRWQPIETAPKGYYRDVEKVVKNKSIVAKVFVKEYCHVLLNGNVYYTHKLEDGRWNGFTKEQKGDAWYQTPAAPSDKDGE